MTPARKPAGRTLAEMLIEARQFKLIYPGGFFGGPIEAYPVLDLGRSIVRRAAEVALLFAKENSTRHVHYSCAAGVSRAILADAGLEVEDE